MAARLDPAMMTAYAEMAKARRMVLVNMFAGTKLRFGKAAMASNAKELLISGKSLASDAKKLAKGTTAAAKTVSLPGFKAAAEGFIRQCADVDNIKDVIDALG